MVGLERAVLGLSTWKEFFRWQGNDRSFKSGSCETPAYTGQAGLTW